MNLPSRKHNVRTRHAKQSSNRRLHSKQSPTLSNTKHNNLKLTQHNQHRAIHNTVQNLNSYIHFNKNIQHSIISPILNKTVLSNVSFSYKPVIKRFMSTSNNNSFKFSEQFHLSSSDQQRVQQEMKEKGIDLNKFESMLAQTTQQDLDTQQITNNKHKKQEDILNSIDLSDSDELTDVDNFTDIENLPEYAKQIDPDDISPSMFNPEEEQLEYIVASMLQSKVQDIEAFPVYLRRPLFKKIISTFQKIAQQIGGSENLSPEHITTVIFDVFTNYAPELCRTHQHALNILFPLSPRVGDIVQLPDVNGKCRVSRREYVDNRWNNDGDEDTEKTRYMTIVYECLHPTLRGKSIRSNHPFDMEVYKLTLQQDERGLERLMHQRGMIDMFTGRILNPEHAQHKRIQDGLRSDPRLEKGPSSQILIEQRASQHVADQDDFEEYETISARQKAALYGGSVRAIEATSKSTLASSLSSSSHRPSSVLLEHSQQHAKPLLLNDTNNINRNNNDNNNNNINNDNNNNNINNDNNNNNINNLPQTIPQQQLSTLQTNHNAMGTQQLSNVGGHLPEELKNKYILDGTEYKQHNKDLYNKEGRKLLFDESAIEAERQAQERMPSFEESIEEKRLRKHILQTSPTMSDAISTYRDSKLIPQNPEHEPSRLNKEYLRPHVLTGEAAQVMYKNLLHNMTDEVINKRNLAKQQHDTNESYASQIKQDFRQLQNNNDLTQNAAMVENLANGIHIGSSSGLMTKKGAVYGPDAIFGGDVAISGSTHNTPAIPNRLTSIAEQREWDAQVEASLSSTIHSSQKESKYMEKVRQMRLEKDSLIKEKLATTQSETYGQRLEREDFEKRQKMDELERLKSDFNILVEQYKQQGHDQNTAIQLADKDFAKIEIEEEEQASNEFMEVMDEIGQESYKSLPQRYKKKYAHCIIKKGPGSGLPDPLVIDRGEDLFELYPNANVALMEFLSDQWSLMVQEKTNKEELNRIKHDQQIDDDHLQRRHEQYEQEHNLSPEDALETRQLREQFYKNNKNNTNNNNANQDTSNGDGDGNDDDNDFKIPADIEATRYRLLATVAAAGDHAFTANYIQQIFQRVMKMSDNKDFDKIVDQQIRQDPNLNELSPEQKKQTKAQRLAALSQYLEETDGDYAEPDSFDKKQQEQQQKQQQSTHSQSPENDITESDYENIHESSSLHKTPEGYFKLNGKLYTPLEYATKIFGQEPIPIEHSPHVPRHIREVIKKHYAAREKEQQNAKHQQHAAVLQNNYANNLQRHLSSPAFDSSPTANFSNNHARQRQTQRTTQQQQQQNYEYDKSQRELQAYREWEQRQLYLDEMKKRNKMQNPNKHLIKTVPLSEERHGRYASQSVPNSKYPRQPPQPPQQQYQPQQQNYQNFKPPQQGVGGVVYPRATPSK